jgi:hypothetical protein
VAARQDPPKKNNWLADYLGPGAPQMERADATRTWSDARQDPLKLTLGGAVRGARKLAGGAIKGINHIPVAISPYGIHNLPESAQRVVRQLGDRVAGSERGLSDLIEPETQHELEQRLADESLMSAGEELAPWVLPVLGQAGISRALRPAEPNLPGILGPEVPKSAMPAPSDVPAFVRRTDINTMAPTTRVPKVPAAEPGYVSPANPQGPVSSRLAPAREMPRITSKQTWHLNNAIEKGGGFTFDPRVGSFVKSGGFMVGGVPGQVGVAVERITPQVLNDFAKKNAHLLSQDGMMMGGWYDKASGKYYLDVSQRVANRDEAIGLLQQRGEKAAWDLDNGAELLNPDGVEAVSAGAEAVPAGLLAEPALAGPQAGLLGPRGNATGLGLDDMLAQESMSAAHQMPGTLPGPRTARAPKAAPAPVQSEHLGAAEWTPEQLEAYGAQHGVRGLGRVSEPHMVKLSDGREVNIPGGMDGTFSYYDLLALKAQGINPNLLPEGMYKPIHAKIMRTMTPENISDQDMWRMLSFGITSPNSPLTPNEFTVSRLMAMGMDDIKKLASMDPKKVPAFLGVQAGNKGGLGTSGSVDYKNVVNLAKKFSENPAWFRRGANEPWDQYVDRIATQVPGLGSKTGSLGVVWQDLPNAGVSAVDRHMTELAMPHIMSHPELGPDFAKRVVESWNKVEGNPTVRSVEEIMSSEGGRIYARDFLASLINNPQAVKMRTSKGAFGKNVPEHLRRGESGWVGAEPAKTNIMNPYYREALAYNAQHVNQGESLFGSQWRLWDHMRGRIEPHEVMYPELWKLPRMGMSDAKAAYGAHKQAGYTLGKPTKNNPVAEGGVLPAVRPVANPMSLGYWGVGGLLLGGGLSAEDQYRQNGGLLLGQ